MTMTIYSIPSLRQPESISPQFYFTSQSFLSKAHHDIDLLLNTWIHAVKSLTPQPQPLNINNLNTNNQRLKLGPFLKFKSIYSRLGWIYVHLSVVDPALRKHWFNTIVRLFLSHLSKSIHLTCLKKEESLRQIGVLFALWCFWGTQPDCSELGPKHFIVIDPQLLDHVYQIPIKLGKQLNDYFNGLVDESFDDSIPSSTHLSSIKNRVHLDPSIFGPPPPTAQPSDSLYQVLKNLIDQNAFLIQPTQVALVYPPLPTNSISFPEIPQDQSSSYNNHTTTPFDNDHHQTNSHQKSNFSSDTAELILSTKSELSKLKKIENKLLCDPDELNQTRSNYLASKNFLTNPKNYMRNNHHHDDNNQDQIQNDDDTGLAKDLFIEAIGMTRKVIQKTGPGLDHLLFPNQPTTTTTNLNHSHDTTSLDAFLLVDHAQSVPQLAGIIENHT